VSEAPSRTVIGPLAAGLLLALSLHSCGIPQRVPEAMPFPEERIGGEEEWGATAAVVMRHSDGVRVQPPGAVAGYPLTHYQTKARLGAGGWIYTTGCGRAEFFWPGRASSLIVSGTSAVRLGDPDRDEALLALREVTHARLVLIPEDRIELPGGAILYGDPERASGPLLLERVASELLRLRNESRSLCRIAYLSASLEVAPGEEIDLPLPSAGSVPADPDSSARLVSTGIVDFRVTGRVEWREVEGQIRITALEESEIEAVGVSVRLAAGEELVLSPPRAMPFEESTPEGERVSEPPAEEGVVDEPPTPAE
jgi:hypothetical protein